MEGLKMKSKREEYGRKKGRERVCNHTNHLRAIGSGISTPKYHSMENILIYDLNNHKLIYPGKLNAKVHLFLSIAIVHCCALF